VISLVVVVWSFSLAEAERELWTFGAEQFLLFLLSLGFSLFFRLRIRRELLPLRLELGETLRLSCSLRLLNLCARDTVGGAGERRREKRDGSPPPKSVEKY